MAKKFITGLVLASMLPIVASAATVEELQAQINALMAQLSAAKPTTSASCSYVFSKALKMGMSDAEVMDLQKVLNSDVATQVSASGVGSAGNETMYFGPATKAAVVKFQNKYAAEVLAPAGLSAGTGLVGPATRAKLNALCTTTTTTTTTTTGNTTTVTGLNGGAGSLTVTSSTSDTEDNVVTGDSKSVLSFKGQADGSDLKVTHVKLKLSYVGNKSNQITRYFTKFDVMMGATKVGSVDAVDFIRDSAGMYSKTLALDNAIIRMGAGNKATFFVKAYGVSAIDSNDTLSPSAWTIESNEYRYADATGVVLSNTTAVSNAGVYVEKLASSSDVKVKYSSGAANPEAKVVFISDTASGDKVTMNEFKIKAEGTNVSFDVLTATTATSSGTSTVAEMVSEFQLVKGGTVIDTVDPASSEYVAATGVITFNIDTAVNIAKDETATFTIVAKMLKIKTATFMEGNALTVNFTSTNPQDKNGDNVTVFSGSATGKAQTFRSTGLNIAKVSSTNTVNANNTTPASSFGEFKMQIKVTASGDDIWVPLTISTSATTTTGVEVSMLDSASGAAAGTTTASVTHVSGGTRDGAYVKIADGESATLEAVVTLDPSAAGQYRLQTNKVGYTLAGATGLATAQISGTPVQDFQSSLSYIQN